MPAVLCDLYGPGHEMHYRHQAIAFRSASVPVRQVLVEDMQVLVDVADGTTLRWRHHHPQRLLGMLDLVVGSRVVHPEAHVLRVGPYWFNCAGPEHAFEACRTDSER